MIVPDAKDWTWVLTRACPECGFDASLCAPDEVATLVRANARTWEHLFDAGAIAPGRPDGATWSTLEYACHVRDVYRRYHERIELMAHEVDPLFANWDQDASAGDDAYEEQDPRAVVSELTAAAGTVAAQLDELRAADWLRTGRRSDGASFRIESIARYMVHDPIHHVADVVKQHH